MPMSDVAEKVYRRMCKRLNGADLQAAQKMEFRLIALIGGLRLNVLYPDSFPNVKTHNMTAHVNQKGELWLYYTVVDLHGVLIRTQTWVGFV